MRIAVRIVPRSMFEAVWMYPPMGDILTFGWDSAHALIFPCESFAQAAIDGFMAQRKASDYYCDIQDLDDPERGPLEPIWTGP